jgi:hypothetical protein
VSADIQWASRGPGDIIVWGRRGGKMNSMASYGAQQKELLRQVVAERVARRQSGKGPISYQSWYDSQLKKGVPTGGAQQDREGNMTPAEIARALKVPEGL